jgi:hypothetical protein
VRLDTNPFELRADEEDSLLACVKLDEVASLLSDATSVELDTDVNDVAELACKLDSDEDA